MTAILGHVVLAPVSGDALALDHMATVRRERAADWATARLWGTTAPLRFTPEQGNRRMVAAGTTLVAEPGSGLPSVTVAEHDTSRFSDGEYGIERYLI